MNYQTLAQLFRLFHDIIRYIEKIPNKCKEDLKIPDVRLIRPKSLIIIDNLEKKKSILSKFF